MTLVTRIDYPAADARLVLGKCNWLLTVLVSRVWCQDRAGLMWCEARVIATDVDPSGAAHSYRVKADTVHDAINVLTQLRRAVVAVEEVTR